MIKDTDWIMAQKIADKFINAFNKRDCDYVWFPQLKIPNHLRFAVNRILLKHNIKLDSND